MCSSCSVRREERERRDESPILLTLKLKEIFMYFQHTSFEDLLKGFSTVIYSCITGSKWSTQRGGGLLGLIPLNQKKCMVSRRSPPGHRNKPPLSEKILTYDHVRGGGNDWQVLIISGNSLESNLKNT